jgi:hypothetical protein
MTDIPHDAPRHHDAGTDRVVPRSSRIARAGVALLAGLTLFACGGSAAAITPATRVSPTPVPTPTPAPTIAATPTPASTVPITKLLTQCPPPRAFSSLQRFAGVSGAGDVDVAPDGSVWVSTGARGVIAHLSATGAAMASYNETTPQGLVALASGDLLFADQGADRIDELSPSTLAVTTFLQLTPRSGQPNVDGLGVDITNGVLLVPDTAQGQLLSIPLSGGQPTLLGGGVPAPVGAAGGPGNVIEIASSSITALLSMPLGGGAAKPYGLSLHLSAVVVSGSLVYFTAPPSKRVYAFNPATGHTAVLVTAIPNPEGLALLANGELIVSDATTGTLATFHAC